MSLTRNINWKHILTITHQKYLLPLSKVHQFTAPYCTQAKSFHGVDGNIASVKRVEAKSVTPTHKTVRSVTHDEPTPPDELTKKTQYTKVHVDDNDPDVQRLYNGILNGNRGCLAQSITLAESSHVRKKAQAQVLLEKVLNDTRKKCKHSIYKSISFRVGEC